METRCAICNGPAEYNWSARIVEGEKVYAHLCYECFNNDYAYSQCPVSGSVFCLDDEYEYENSYWCPETLHKLPLKEHSTSTDSDHPAQLKCVGCGDSTHIYHTNGRGQVTCTSCSADRVRCGAAYCKTYIHKASSVKLGTKYYCDDCSKVPTPPLPTMHPYKWEYEVGCGCSMCTYLADKMDRWPSPETPIIRDTECTACGHSDSAGNMTPSGDFNEPHCHMCTWSWPKCPRCGIRKSSLMGHPLPLIQNLGSIAPYENCCNSCAEHLVQEHDLWYCDVSCNQYIIPDMDCNCGGVYPWNYTPEQLHFMVGKLQKDREIKSPFYGLELEIEAHKGSSSRVKGAKLTRDMLGSIGWCMHDGSLKGHRDDGTGGDYGFEFVTHPFTFDWLVENWHTFENYLSVLRLKGYRSWDGGRCGMHIHVGRTLMTDAHQMKFLRFIYGSTNLMLTVGQRNYNDRNLAKFAPFDGERRFNMIHKVRNFTNPGVSGHYTAVNTSRKSTIEGRWFRGTLNPTGVLKNIQLMDSMWWFTKQYGFRAANEMNFITWLKEPVNASRYSVLIDYLNKNYITRR